jgi:hypothetical protein
MIVKAVSQRYNKLYERKGRSRLDFDRSG